MSNVIPEVGRILLTTRDSAPETHWPYAWLIGWVDVGEREHVTPVKGPMSASDARLLVAVTYVDFHEFLGEPRRVPLRRATGEQP